MKNIVAIAVSVLFALLIVEIGLRVFDPLGLEPHASQEQANVSLENNTFYFCKGGPDQLLPHPELYSREAPNQAYFEFLNDIVSLVETNEYGFRGEFDPEGSDDRIVVLGDSFIRGTLADETETIPALLSQWSKGSHFVNLGTGGHGTMQHLLTYREFKDKLPHDTVLLFVFNGNDLVDNVDFLAWQDNAKSDLHEPTLMQRAKRMLVKLHIGKLLQRFSSTYLNPTEYPSRPTDEERTLFLNSLAEISQTVADQDARLFVFSLPEVAEFFPEGRLSYRKDSVGYGDATRELLNEAAEVNGFTYLPLKPVLENASRELGVPTLELFGDPDHHMREIGNFAAARAVAELLQDNGVSVFTPDDQFVDRTKFEPSDVACP